MPTQSPLDASQSGLVASGGAGLGGARVVIMQAGTTAPQQARVLGRSVADDQGRFTVDYREPADDAVVYVVADVSVGGGGTGTVRFASVLSGMDTPSQVVVNERTTVAASYSMAQFIQGSRIGGTTPGLPNAALTFHNLADIGTGEVGDVLASAPNGEETSAQRTVNSLANMLSACVQSSEGCERLLDLTTTPKDGRPATTLDAMVNLAHTPGTNVVDLLALAQDYPTYGPALEAGAATDESQQNYVNSWVVALRYLGADPADPVLDGPGNIAFDDDGYAWVNNNYAYSPDLDEVVCGSTALVRLTPDGRPAPGSPFGGDDETQDGVGAGGLYGAGFGIAIDPKQQVWVTNFGFQGMTVGADPAACQNDVADLALGVSVFNPDGTAKSPDGSPRDNQAGGYQVTSGGAALAAAQGVESDPEGNVWMVGCAGGTVARFAGGDPDQADLVTVANSPGVNAFDKAFDVALDRGSNAWVTGHRTDNVVQVDKDLGVTQEVSDGFTRPMGIASDSAGNMWVASAGEGVQPPCGQSSDQAMDDPSPLIGNDGSDNLTAAATLIDTSGSQPTVTRYGRTGPRAGQRGGLRWPWGIAVDGDDTVWVANFTGQRIMQMCGAATENCPGGARTGDALSPTSGYYNNALQRVTAAEVDPSGNVWLTNNWRLDGFRNLANPGGNQVVVFVGAAEPVDQFSPTFVVNSTGDGGDGVCDESECTLREAVLAANAVSGATVTFDLPRGSTIVLGGEAVSVSSDVVIQGPGSRRLSVSGEDSSAVFQVNSAAEVSIEGLTITRGRGGGVVNAGTLTVLDSVVTDNRSNRGAGLLNRGGGLTISGSQVEGNTAVGIAAAGGGGVYNAGGAVAISQSTVKDNRARGTRAVGGGIANRNGSLTMDSSTVSGNTASSSGGGVWTSTRSSSDATQSAVVTNTTISGNTAGPDGGGGVQNRAGLLNMSFSTVTRNASVGAGVATGGGSAAASTEMFASTVAGNTGVDVTVAGDPDMVVSLGSNVVGFGTAVSSFVQDNDQRGIALPLLSPLGDFGGPTATHALGQASPAVGNLATGACPVDEDQRGTTRPQGPACDAGSFERAGAITERVAGLNRYEVAANIAARYPEQVDTVYLANGQVFSDAVSAAAPAAAGLVPSRLQTPEGGASPVLLTRRDRLPASTEAILATGQINQVVIVGGTNTISPRVRTQLEGYGATVVRVSGKDRYEVSAKLAELFTGITDTVYIASGEERAAGDSLSGGPLAATDAAPILLTRTNRVAAPTRQALAALDPEKVTVLGGPASVSPEVYDDTFATTRIGGADRYAVSANVATRFDPDIDRAFIASGQAYADALTGSALAGATTNPLLLSRRNEIPSRILDQLVRLSPNTLTVLGGPRSVTPSVTRTLNNAYPDWP